MSKITEALEKAARERLKQFEEKPTAPSVTVAIPFSPVNPRAIGDVPTVGELNIDPHVVSITASKSPIAEQYRMLKANFQSQRSHGNLKTIVVTSAMNEEGKSITSLNLALTLARDEQLKVVLVDADMRKSSINQWMGIKETQTGLSTILRDGGALNGSLMKLQSPALTILPAGPMPEDPIALLESAGMKRLLASLKAQFDLVIIDAPPVLPVADPGILGAQADGTILVVRAGRTQRRMVVQAQNRLHQMKVDIIGCVLTHVDQPAGGYYYYHAHNRQKSDGIDASTTN